MRRSKPNWRLCGRSSERGGECCLRAYQSTRRHVHSLPPALHPCTNRFMSRPTSIVPGQRFGSYVAVQRVDGAKPVQWLCRCDCGEEREVWANNLKSGGAKSCGCSFGVPRERHGLRWRPEYSTWTNMRRRCQNPADTRYPYYGGKGITVCARWRSFSAFIDDMGPRPSNAFRLKRVDTDGNYEPENCYWETREREASPPRRPSSSGKDGSTT